MKAKFRRRFFPTRRIFWLFIGYAALFATLVRALFVMNRLSADSWEMAVHLQLFNLGAMAVLGLIVFFLGRLFMEAKFIKFIGRLDDELRRDAFQPDFRFLFRQSVFTPWSLDGLNELIQARRQVNAKISELMNETLQTVNDISRSPQPDASRLAPLIEDIERFERKQQIAGDGK